MKIRVLGLCTVVAAASMMFGGVAAADPPPPIQTTEAPHNGAELAPTKPVVSISDAVGNEGGNISFNVTLSKASTEATQVRISSWHLDTGPGDLSLGGQGYINFVPGQMANTANVLLVDGDGPEPSELFKVELFNPVGLTIGDGVAIGTVLDGDGPALEIYDTSASEGDASDGESLVFEVAATYAPLTDVSFNFRTDVIGFEAEPAVDFLPIDVIVTLPAGSPSVKVSVPVIGDEQVENDELVTASIQNPSVGSLGDDTALGTIIDDDKAAAPSPEPSAPTPSEPTEPPPIEVTPTETPAATVPSTGDTIPASVPRGRLADASEDGTTELAAAPDGNDPAPGDQRVPLVLGGLALAAALLAWALKRFRSPRRTGRS